MNTHTHTRPIIRSLKQLSAVINEIGKETQVIAIVGAYLRYSISHEYYEAAFRKLLLPYVFLRIEIKPEEFPQFMINFVHPRTRTTMWNLWGLAVTCPYKEAIVPFLPKKSLDVESRHLRAVNTVALRGDNFDASNTDVGATIKALEHFEYPLKSKHRIAIIGTGGMAAAFASKLLEYSKVYIVGRNERKARALMKRVRATGWRPLDKFKGNFDIIINATPVGMLGGPDEHKSVVPAEVFKNNIVEIALDSVYTGETPFMRYARKGGCHVDNGLRLFEHQFKEQFVHLTGKAVPDGLKLKV